VREVLKLRWTIRRTTETSSREARCQISKGALAAAGTKTWR